MIIKVQKRQETSKKYYYYYNYYYYVPIHNKFFLKAVQFNHTYSN